MSPQAIVSQIKIRAFAARLTLGKGRKTPKHYLNIYSREAVGLGSTQPTDPAGAHTIDACPARQPVVDPGQLLVEKEKVVGGDTLAVCLLRANG